MKEQTSALRRLDDQRGMTLVELVVAMAVLSIAMVILLSTLTSIQTASVREDVRSRTINEARLAMQSIDRQVRSGNLLYQPNAGGYTLLIYTQAYAVQDQAVFGTTSRCALWTINSQNQLMYGYWEPNDPTPTSTWQVIAEGVLNRVASPAVTAFSLDPTGRTMTVQLLVNADATNSPTATERLQTSVTGRNTSFGYPLAVCSTLPTNVPT
jgi:prepilin-type N-terminal cleavage/methylation domain-containing protein